MVTLKDYMDKQDHVKWKLDEICTNFNDIKLVLSNILSTYKTIYISSP